MNFDPRRFILMSVCALLLGGLFAGGAAAEPGRPALSDQGAAGAETPCVFFRGQAYRQGVVHFASEMLWVCEAIAARRAARMPLGDRLAATEAAMERYRDAVISAGRMAFAETRSSDIAPRIHGLSDEAKHRIAAETGALVALEAIREGF
jgi:hypothetical protein